jgi:hypothetical protein
MPIHDSNETRLSSGAGTCSISKPSAPANSTTALRSFVLDVLVFAIVSRAHDGLISYQQVLVFMIAPATDLPR